MDGKRTLHSYKIIHDDKLMLTYAKTKTQFWRSVANTSNDLVVIINCENPINLTKTMRFPPSTTIAEIKTIFFKKINLLLPTRLFGIYSKFPNSDEEDLFPDHLKLSTFPLTNPARFMCKYHKREPIAWFGSSPSSLPKINDDGFSVPEVLVILKDLIDIHDGYRTEGIFRKSGLDREMNLLKNELEKGLPITPCDNVHSIATLMKRWFKELPKRLFVGVDLAFVCGNDQLKLKFPAFLTVDDAAVFSWLLNLLVIPIRNKEFTFMDAKNLGLFLYFIFFSLSLFLFIFSSYFQCN